MEDGTSLEGCEPRPRCGGRSPPQLASGATDEDVVRRRVQHPVVPFPGIVIVTRDFHETLIQTQIVSNRVLPALLVLLVVGEVLHDVLIDAVEREPSLGTAAYGHHDERIVAVGRFFIFLFIGGGAAWRRRLRTGDIQLRVGGRGGPRRRLRQKVSDGEARRTHSCAASRAARSGLSGATAAGLRLAVRPGHRPLL